MAELLRPQQQELVTPPELTTIDPKFAARYFFGSYFHGQGSRTLTEYWYYALAAQRPNLRMTDEVVEKVLELTDHPINSVATGKNHGPLNGLRSDQTPNVAEFQIRFMQEILNEDVKRELPPEILFEKIVQRDEYVLQNGGRPRENPDPSNPYKDPWLSFFCHFGMNGISTGLAPMDTAYKSAADYFSENPVLDWETDGALDFVIRTYNENHPNQTVQWPTTSQVIGK